MPIAHRNSELLRGIGLLSLMLVLLLGAYYVLNLHWQDGWLREASGYVVGRDFLNFWMAGKAAQGAEPGIFYDPRIYTAALEQMLGGRYMQQWSYPPTVLLYAAPFGLLPYLAALVLWLGLGAALLVWAIKKVTGLPRWLVLVSPAALLCIWCGQHSLLATAALLAAFHYRARRPLLAGIMLGLLTLKPQLGILLPVLLLAERNWRCIAAAALTTTTLVCVTAAIWGSDVLLQYVNVGVPVQGQVLRDLPALIAALMPTLFSQLWIMGVGYEAAMAVQAACALLVIVVAYRWFRRALPAHQCFAVLTFGTLLATPYLMAYDTLALTVAVLWFAANENLSTCERAAIWGMVFLPLLQIFGVLLGVPLALVPMIGFGVLLAQPSRPNVAAAEAFRPVD